MLWAGQPAASYSAGILLEKLNERGIPVVQAERGQKLDLGSGAKLEVAAVSRGGAVLLLEWDRFRALLPVGLDFDTQAALMGEGGGEPVTALLLADGGHAALNPPGWIDQWRPQVALLSVGERNLDGLPHEETLAALGGIQLLRTDVNGWIEISTDGEQMWVEAAR